MNDLWHYNVSTDEWRWISGGNIVDQVAVYGMSGSGAGSNTPGAREAAIPWRDLDDNLWLFGGLGYASTASAGKNTNFNLYLILVGRINDLWQFKPSTREWTWVSGNDTIDAVGNYGVKNVSSPLNYPGARFGATSWTDSSGDLWLFGGYGLGSTSTQGYLNDLWRFNPSTGEWTWVGGSNMIGQPGSYGQQGTGSTTNYSGTRFGAISWTNSLGHFWLFGGDSNGTIRMNSSSSKHLDLI